MTQPIDVAYVEIVPRTKDFGKIASKEITSELKSVEKSAGDVADNITKSFQQAGEQINGTFRDVNGRLRDSRGRFAAAGEAASGVLAEGLQTAAGAARTFSGSLTGLFSGLSQVVSSGPVGIALLAGAFIALGAAASVAAAAIQSLATIAFFAIGTLPGLIGAAIAGFGILAVALNGVTEAFQEQSKAATSAGGVAVSNARQIADAQRGIVEAQRNLVKAREDELERIQDIRRELIAARVGELRAIDNVKKAQFELAEAQRIGTPRAVEEAQLNLLEANAALDAAKDKTEDLAKEKAKSDKVGVEGSDQVLRAQEALRDAQDRLAAAQQRVSVGAAAQNVAFNKLTDSAQAFVTALLNAKKQLGPLADAIQEAFFAGTAPLIQPIVDNLLELRPELVRVSAAFGNIFKEILKFLGSDEAQSALRSILAGLADFLEAITPAIQPLLKAFAGLAGQSGQFGKILGDVVATALLKIADFISKVDLKQLFEDAKKAVDELLPVVIPLLSIMTDLFTLMVALGKRVIPPLAVALDIVSDAFSGFVGWITDASDKVHAFVNLLQTDPAAAAQIVKDAIVGAAHSVADAFDQLLINVSETLENIQKKITNLPETLKKLAPKLLAAGRTLIEAFFEGMEFAGGLLGDIGKKIANSVIRFINRSVISNINTAIKKIQDGLNSLPIISGVSLPTIPNIPQLAEGGLSTRNTLAEISEGNKEEAVLPLTNSRAMSRIANAIAEAGGGGLGGEQINFAAGSVMVNFEGVIPTEQQAFNTGKAVADGIVRRLAARKSRIAVRML